MKKNNEGELKHILCGVFVVFVVYGCARIMPASSNNSQRDWLAALAQVQCEDSVRLSLRAPSVAEFGNARTVGIVDSEKTITFDVSLVVDAQNAFGGIVRDYFRCQMLADKDTRIVSTLLVTRERERL